MPFRAVLTRRRSGLALWCAVAALFVAPAGAADAKLLTGPDLKTHLAAPTSGSWKAIPLRQALARLSAAHRVAILLDRRLDPGAPLDFAATDRSLGDLLGAIAAQVHAGYAQVGDVAFIGPPETARTIRTVQALTALQIAQLPERERRAWGQRAAISWPELAEPAALLKRWCGEARIELAGLDQVPHDLWPAFDGPLLTLADRVTLLAAQFDLALTAPAGGDVRLQPWPDPVAIERTYPAGADAAGRLAEWRAAAPSATIELRGAQLVVRGLVEDHERLAPPRTAARPTGGRGKVEQRHRLAVKNAPFDKLLAELHERLGLEFTYDAEALAAAGVAANAPVTVDVENATTDELLEKICAPLALKFKRRGPKVEIWPAKPAGPK